MCKKHAEVSWIYYTTSKLLFTKVLMSCLVLFLTQEHLHGQLIRQWGGETITSWGGAEFRSVKFGQVIIEGNSATSNLAWVPGLNSFVMARDNGTWSSPEYGELQRANNDAGWLISSLFGWTHFAPSADEYGGWIWTERFRWMKFERPWSAVYLWVPIMRSWLSVLTEGDYFSFQWGLLKPRNLHAYSSETFGEMTSGDFGGWVHSYRFGWMWASGDGSWFWSDAREEWLGMTPGGGIWSTKERRFLGALHSDMVLVEGGSIDGVSVDEDGDRNNYAAETFWIGKYEVTWGEWKKVRAWAVNNGYEWQDADGYAVFDDEMRQVVPAGCLDNHPVVWVNWYDAVKWCNAKSEMKGLIPVYYTSGNVFRRGMSVPLRKDEANGFRLPSRSEWMFAMRGGLKTKNYFWSGGDEIDLVAWYRDNSKGSDCNLWDGRGTWPVGYKNANELGLHDMHGNVWEWCWDGFGQFLTSNRAYSGGSWSHRDEILASETMAADPTYRNDDRGFRLARNYE